MTKQENKTKITTRFYKQYKIVPYVTIRLSKKGVSVRIGGKRLGLTIGGGGIYISGSLAGTGIGFRRKLTLGKAKQIN